MYIYKYFVAFMHSLILHLFMCVRYVLYILGLFRFTRIRAFICSICYIL